MQIPRLASLARDDLRYCGPETRHAASLRGALSLPGLFRVVAGAVADFVIEVGIGKRYLDVAEVGVGQLLLGVVADEVLRPQLLGDLVEGGIELGHAGGVVVLAAGVVGKLDKRVLSANVAASIRLNRDDDDAVDNCLRLLRGADG